MIYKDIAQEINMDISTISRVVNGKYVQSPQGIHELNISSVKDLQLTMEKKFLISTSKRDLKK